MFLEEMSLVARRSAALVDGRRIPRTGHAPVSWDTFCVGLHMSTHTRDVHLLVRRVIGSLTCRHGNSSNTEGITCLRSLT